MSDVNSVDARTGEIIRTVAQENSVSDVAQLCRQAQFAKDALERLGRFGRAFLLESCADMLEGNREVIVATADQETALGVTRLNGELTRACFQLRLFAEVLREGSYVEAVIDHAGESAMGIRPDIRRMLTALGPVAVFGSSNFPLAFSVPGGDTASALAAGCPVIIKAHPSHCATSQLCYEILSEAVAAAGAAEGTLALVHGLDAGSALVAHPAIRAVAFTGSLNGGKALMSIINDRPEPIPFYGELSSLNPVVVTPTAAAQRAEAIGQGLINSATLGSGQLCTKPGIMFVPHGADGDRIVSALVTSMSEIGPQWLLNERIAQSYAEGTQRLISEPGVSVIATGGAPHGSGFQVAALLLSTEVDALTPELSEECFGPVTIVARYRDEQALMNALTLLPASLTATIQMGESEQELPGKVSLALRERSGRLVFNGFPTGVAVSWAQNHGGPWPSTNSSHTSVGATAIRRFLRPVAWQDAPESLLPTELREDGPPIPRRVDGKLVVSVAR